MKKLTNDVNKFSIPQMTSNADGKTSASGTMGVLICVVGAMCFLLGCVDKMWVNKDVDIITQSIIFVGIGASLLGLRKFKSTDFAITQVKYEQQPLPEPQPVQPMPLEGPLNS